ncbi:MAG: DUF2244 domain-containing protein [Gammaproteobacteria bacterium]
MVQTEINQASGNGSIVLTPNNSASWRFNMLVLASLGFILGMISVFFLIQGLWLILPFSGLEILALFSGLYLCVRANITIEVITFGDHVVRVERGRKSIEQSWEYPRSWSKIFVRNPQYRGHPKKIFIRSHGKELELGAFLNKRDKDLLIKKLKHLVYC